MPIRAGERRIDQDFGGGKKRQLRGGSQPLTMDGFDGEDGINTDIASAIS